MEQSTFMKQLMQNVDNLESVDPDSNLQAVPEWDSLAILSCIAFVDSEYNIRIGGKELGECETLKGVYDLVRLKAEAPPSST